MFVLAPSIHHKHAGKERTFEFLQAVLEEVMELFPSRYIHIGGDECPKTRWTECEACQRRIREQKLSGTEQLQTYFINRIATFLRERGRCIIGWDEVLEGGSPEEGSAATGDAALAADAIVMSWRGTLGGITAAKHKHRVIMTPNTRCYLDYRQSASLQVRLRRCHTRLFTGSGDTSSCGEPCVDHTRASRHAQLVDADV